MQDSKFWKGWRETDQRSDLKCLDGNWKDRFCRQKKPSFKRSLSEERVLYEVHCESIVHVSKET